MIHLKEINKENLTAFLKLKVHENQRDQVASNAVSIAQGNYHDEAWFRGVYWDETPVGFVMLSLKDETKEYWVWRYMIDKDQQGKGYGKAALIQVMDFMKTISGIEEISLTYVPKKENGANFFYEKLGFVDTGIDYENSGEIMMKYVVK